MALMFIVFVALFVYIDCSCRTIQDSFICDNQFVFKNVNSAKTVIFRNSFINKEDFERFFNQAETLVIEEDTYDLCHEIESIRHDVHIYGCTYETTGKVMTIYLDQVSSEICLPQ